MYVLYYHESNSWDAHASGRTLAPVGNYEGKYQGSILQHCKSLDCVKGYCPSTWCIIVRNHPQSIVV